MVERRERVKVGRETDEYGFTRLCFACWKPTSIMSRYQNDEDDPFGDVIQSKVAPLPLNPPPRCEEQSEEEEERCERADRRPLPSSLSSPPNLVQQTLSQNLGTPLQISQSLLLQIRIEDN